MRFNPGDIVECITESRLLTKGRQYTIDEVRNGMVFIRGKYSDGSTPNYGECPWLFKLVRTAAAEANLREFERDRIPARKTDPGTSKVAAVRANRTGLRERIMNVMSGGNYEPREQGWTGKELAAQLEVPLNSVTPRFAELAGTSASYKKPPRIKDSGQRRDGQIVWVLV